MTVYDLIEVYGINEGILNRDNGSRVIVYDRIFFFYRSVVTFFLINVFY